MIIEMPGQRAILANLLICSAIFCLFTVARVEAQFCSNGTCEQLVVTGQISGSGTVSGLPACPSSICQNSGSDPGKKFYRLRLGQSYTATLNANAGPNPCTVGEASFSLSACGVVIYKKNANGTWNRGFHLASKNASNYNPSSPACQENQCASATGGICNCGCTVHGSGGGPGTGNSWHTRFFPWGESDNSEMPAADVPSFIAGVEMNNGRVIGEVPLNEETVVVYYQYPASQATSWNEKTGV